LDGYVGYVHVLGEYSVDFVDIIDIVHFQGTKGVVSLDASDVGSSAFGFGEDGRMDLDQGGGSERLECVECGRCSPFFAIFGETDINVPFDCV
jgi:hypothetical protein